MIYIMYIVIECPMSYIAYMLSIPVVGGGVGGLPVGGGGGGGGGGVVVFSCQFKLDKNSTKMRRDGVMLSRARTD